MLYYDLKMEIGVLFPKNCLGYFDIPGPMILYFAYRLIFLQKERLSRLRKMCFVVVDILLTRN